MNIALQVAKLACDGRVCVEDSKFVHADRLSAKFVAKCFLLNRCVDALEKDVPQRGPEDRHLEDLVFDTKGVDCVPCAITVADRGAK